MAESFGIRVEGGRQFRASVKAFDPKLLDELKGAHKETADLIAGEAAPDSPHGETGALGASVRGAGTAAQSIIRAGGAKVRYAGPVHFGWAAHNMTAQPWITDTAQRTEPRWIPIFEDARDRALDTIRGV